MSRKRPGFEIDLSDDLSEAPAPDVAPDTPSDFPARPGPMASALLETAESLTARRGVEADIRAENDAIATEHVRLSGLGLVAELVPLEKILTWKLTRDRDWREEDDLELPELIESIREVGLSNPIRLEARADGDFELIQGFRRLTAYRKLLEETEDHDAWGAIPAVVATPGESLDMLYRRMVDENLVRTNVSYAELARLAIDYAADPGTGVRDPERAVRVLYRSASYQKRSYIRGFLPLMEALGFHLRFARHIPRALGLELSERLSDMPELVGRIRAKLEQMDHRGMRDEIDLLRRMTGIAEEEARARVAAAKSDPAPAPAPHVPMPRPLPATEHSGGSQLRLDVVLPVGRAQVLVEQGRIEIRAPGDFAARERQRIIDAVKALLEQLER